MKNCISIQKEEKKVILKISDEVAQKEILADLKKKASELKKMYKENAIPILITGKVFKNDEMDQIKESIKKNLNIENEANLEIEFDSPKILGLHGIKKTFSRDIATSETKFHRGSLRSGQKVEYEGSLVILGDVNSGAEVLAGENIVVLGILRGMAHAGAKGNKEAIIAAASIEAPQIRISNLIKEIEKQDYEGSIKTYAYVEEDKLILE